MGINSPTQTIYKKIISAYNDISILKGEIKQIMAATIVKSLQDCKHLSVVPVIASFDATGDILPLYLRIDGIQLKILSCKLRSKNNACIQHDCIVQDDNREKHIVLTYFLREHTWAVEYNVK